MPKPDLEDIQKIFNGLVLPFYAVKRDMYVPSEGDRPENDAEHSWSLAFMAFMLAPIIDKELDVGRAVIYAIIHDLVEIYAGDTSVWATKQVGESKQEREKQSLLKIATEYRDYPHLTSYMNNYSKKTDAESKFIYALDKFHNWLTAYSGGDYYYKKLRKITKSRSMQKMAEARPKAKMHPIIGMYYDRLIQEFDKHPEYFYPEGGKA